MRLVGLLRRLLRGKWGGGQHGIASFSLTPSLYFSLSSLPTGDPAGRQHVLRRGVSRPSGRECRKHFIY